MDERQLRYLTAIAEHKSIQKCSQALGKDPSTLTRTVKKAEEELGIRIFNRTPKGLETTKEGEILLSYGKSMLKLCCEIKNVSRTQNVRGIRNGHGTQGDQKITGDRKISDDRKIQGAFGDGEVTMDGIRYLLAVEEAGGISQAARVLYISQPSLSQMIGKMEHQWQISIFMREKEGVLVTEEGRRILELARELRKLDRELDLTLDEYRNMERGSITFGIPLNLGTFLLPKILPRFSRQYPGIQVHFIEENSVHLDKMVLEGKTDFNIMHFQEENGAVTYQPFFDDPFYLVVPESMAVDVGFAKDRELSGEDFKKMSGKPFIMVAQKQKLRQVADGILKRAEVCPQIRLESKSMETAKRLCAAGLGATLLPASYLNLFSDGEGLCYYPLEEELGGCWKMVVATPKHGRLSACAREFLRMLKAELRIQKLVE
ncbi:MAG: LysR substrate-binding domain-containing protein [Lachnospiraceae bacterium]